MGIKIGRIRIRAMSQQKRGSVTIAGLCGIVQRSCARGVRQAKVGSTIK
jgi:hypothetical protein